MPMPPVNLLLFVIADSLYFNKPINSQHDTMTAICTVTLVMPLT